jgi:hypothetical protein
VRLALLALVGCLSVPGFAVAQTAVGKAVVGGKTVTLFDDGTWKFADAATAGMLANCEDVTPTVQFCGAPLGWSGTTPPSPEISAACRIDTGVTPELIDVQAKRVMRT